MSENKSAAEAATLFNNFAMEFRSRIDTLLKSVFLISGGVLSITIGAFISATPPSLSEEALCSIKVAWYSFSLSIIAALTTMFLLIIAQAQTSSEWQRRIESNTSDNKVINNPAWFRVVMWVIGVSSFVACIVGLSYISYGAGQVLVVQP